MATVRARRVRVPTVLADSERFAGADYASAYAVAAPGARSAPPERWCRAVFEGSPAPLRAALVLGWTQVLRLRLGPRPSPGHVLGWRMCGPVPSQNDSFDSLVLAARGLVTAYQVVLVTGDRALWATAVHYRRAAARAVWNPIRPVHELTVPILLTHVARSFSHG